MNFFGVSLEREDAFIHKPKAPSQLASIMAVQVKYRYRAFKQPIFSKILVHSLMDLPQQPLCHWKKETESLCSNS